MLVTFAAALSTTQRKTLRALAIGLGLVAAAVCAIALGFEPWLRARVQGEASRQGISLKFEDFSVGFSTLTLYRVSFEQEHPLRAAGTAEQIVVQLQSPLQGWRPSSIVVEKPDVDLLASPGELLARLNAPMVEATQQRNAPPDVSARNLTLDWRPASGQPPWATCSGASMSMRSSLLQLECNAAVMGLPAALLHLRLDREQHLAQIEATSSIWPALRLAAAAKFATDPLLITVTLPETPLPLPLSVLLGVPALETAAVSGRIELRWPLALSMQTPGGTALFTLKNFEPPHPVELQGFDFGKQTDLVTDFSLSRDHKKLALKNIRVQAGAFSLTGDGAIDASRARVNLQGSLSCALLARAAAEAQVGSALGKWAGRLAGKLALQQVEGKVAFEVDAGVELDGKSLPRVEKRVHPGCGLKPLKLEELLLFQAPKPGFADLVELGTKLGEMLPRLPEPPPPLPGLPLPNFGTSPRQLVPAAPSSSARP